MDLMLCLVLSLHATDLHGNGVDSNASTPSTTSHPMNPEGISRSSSGEQFLEKSANPTGQSEYDAGYQLRWIENKPTEAFEKFKLAAEKGHKEALLSLATMATHGIGCERDILLAIDCYSVLEDDPQAMNNLGALYESFNPDGDKNRKDVLLKAKGYYEKSVSLDPEIGKNNFDRVTRELKTLGVS